MATTLDDLIELRPADTLPVLGVPEIFRAIIDYLDDSTDATSGVTVQSPIGIVTPFAGTTAPTGWLFCDGSSISNVNYPDLWAVIGTTYGGTNETNFYLPDMRRRYPLGSGGTKQFTAVESTSYDDNAQDSDVEIDTGLGEYGGEEKHVLLRLELPAQGVGAGPRADESTSAPYGEVETQTITRVAGKESTSKMPLSEPLGTGTAMNLMPPSLVLNYIIKAKP